VWCLGDTVGYGPRSERVLRRRGGTHPPTASSAPRLVVLGEIAVSDFNDEAAAVAVWTSEVLTERASASSPAWPPPRTFDGVELSTRRARPGVGVRPHGGGRPRHAGAHERPIVLVGTRHVHSRSRLTPARCTEVFPRTGPRSSSRGVGRSPRGRSDSPVTATRGRRGCCSISTGGLPSSTGSNTRFSRHS